MKRQIKFRGLCVRARKWVYGYLSNYDVINTDNGRLKVKPESVGQFTGLKDKNGVEIYDGDIISYYGSKEGKEIGYSKDGRLVWKVPQGHFTIQVIEIHDEFQMEVIGNIHQEKEVTNG